MLVQIARDDSLVAGRSCAGDVTVGPDQPQPALPDRRTKDGIEHERRTARSIWPSERKTRRRERSVAARRTRRAPRRGREQPLYPVAGLRSARAHSADSGISDGDFRHLAGHGVLDRRESQHEMADGVPDRLSNRVSQRSHLGQALRVCEHMISHFAAFGAVAVKQRLPAEPVRCDRELPGQIEGVLHAGVHALAARRAVHMGCVAAEEGPPPAIAASTCAR